MTEHATIPATDEVVQMVKQGEKREMCIPLDSVEWDLSEETKTPDVAVVKGETRAVRAGIIGAEMQLAGELTPRMWSRQGYPMTSKGIRRWMDEYIGRTGVDWRKYHMDPRHEMFRLTFDNHD